MDMKHCSSTDLERVRSGTASAEETEAVGRHVARCAECAALAGRALSIVDSAAAFRAAFTVEPGVPARRPLGWLKPAAPLAAAAAIAAVVIFMPRTERVEGPRPSAQPAEVRRPVRHHVRPPASVPTIHPLVAEVRRTGVLPFPAEIRRLAERDAFRGPGDDVARGRVWPAATAIDDVQPELRWPSIEGARFIVSITSDGEEVARSEELATSRWRAPELRRDRMYRWQVNVERGEESFVVPAPPAPPAIFRVLSQREHEELGRAVSGADGDRLLLGLLYARAGLVDDARRQLESHERETNDPLPRRLLRQLP